MVCDWQWAQSLLKKEKFNKIVTIKNDLFSEKQLRKLKYRYQDALRLWYLQKKCFWAMLDWEH